MRIKNFKNFNLLLEERGSALAVRTVVKDIINLFKSGITGYFTLPHDRNTSYEEYSTIVDDDDDYEEEDYQEDYDVEEDDTSDIEELKKESYDDDYDDDDYDDEDDEESEEKQQVKYDFPDFPVYFWCTVVLIQDTSLNRFRINASAGLFDIKVEITYNPDTDMNNPKFWDELSAELNIDVAHELEHLLQNYFGEFPKKQRHRSNFQYYMLPVEVPAQVAGFKRLYDLERRRNPNVKFEELVRYWFLNRRYISRITRKSENTIIANIVNTAKQKYPSIK